MVLLIILSAARAYADCTSPAATEGSVIYNSAYKIVQFCNGTSWINAASSSSGSGATGLGTLNAGAFCTSDGSVVNCTTSAISLTTQVSGVLQAGQFPALTGDVTTSAGSLATTIGAGKVTNSMLAGSIALSKLAATGSPSSTTYLRGDGTWTTAGATPGGSAGQMQYNSGGSALGGATALVYGTSGALLTATAQAATDTPVVIKAAASQSNDLMQVQDSTGAPMASIDSGGKVTTFKMHLTGVAGGPGTGTGVVGGISGYVQFNNAGAFGGDSALFWDNTNKRLGIGTTSPASPLHIYTDTNSTTWPLVSNRNSGSGAYVGLLFQNDGAKYAYLTLGGSAATGGANYLTILNQYAAPITFSTNNTERVRIDSSGNVGIGTTSPGARLTVVESTANQDAIQGFQTYSNRTAVLGSASSGAYAGYFQINGGPTCYLLSGTSWTCGSDRRRKKDIKPITDALSKLGMISGVSFRWKHGDERINIGVIAQDVQRAFPEVVTKSRDGYLAVDYNGLVAPLIEAVKELKADNDNLRALVEKQGREFEAYRAAHP